MARLYSMLAVHIALLSHLGMGCSPSENGTVAKGIAIIMATDWLVELEKTYRLPTKTSKPAPKRVKQSRRYHELAAEKTCLEKEIKRLTSARTASETKLTRLADKACAAS